jgi:hypothetical protein
MKHFTSQKSTTQKPNPEKTKSAKRKPNKNTQLPNHPTTGYSLGPNHLRLVTMIEECIPAPNIIELTKIFPCLIREELT